MEWENYLRILTAMGGNISLTESEMRTIKWLAGCEWQTIDNLVSIITKIREAKEA